MWPAYAARLRVSFAAVTTLREREDHTLHEEHATCHTSGHAEKRAHSHEEVCTVACVNTTEWA